MPDFVYFLEVLYRDDLNVLRISRVNRYEAYNLRQIVLVSFTRGTIGLWFEKRKPASSTIAWPDAGTLVFVDSALLQANQEIIIIKKSISQPSEIVQVIIIIIIIIIWVYSSGEPQTMDPRQSTSVIYVFITNLGIGFQSKGFSFSFKCTVFN